MRSCVPVVMLVATVGCNDMRDASKPITVKTPEGTVTAHETTVDPAPQKIAVVSGDKLARLQSLSTQGPGFVAAYLPDARDPSLKDYDRAFRAWQISKAPKHSKEQVIEILGGYLGNKCIGDFDMEWVTVTDQYGTD